MVSSGYQAFYYRNTRTGEVPVKEYIDSLPTRDSVKVNAYIALLVESGGYLDEPYSKHIKGSIRELRVDFARNRHRIFYFTVFGKRIVLLSAFLKKTVKTPLVEIAKAQANHDDFLTSELGR